MSNRVLIDGERIYESEPGQIRKKSDKIITAKEAASYVKEDSVLMVGGFIGVGSPLTIIEQILENGTKNLTLIANDTVVPNRGTGKMIVNNQFKKIIVSHIGTNPETGKQMNAGTLEVELVPQGTLAERIRAGGSGLGGILTPTGIGTEVEEGKQKITINGKEFLIELPLRAEIALIKGHKVDKKGNIYYNKSARNFNPLMAMAADLVIVEADEIVEVGEINPNDVVTPGIFVDYIVEGGMVDG